MSDLGTFNDELIRLGPEDGNHMDLTADGLDIFDGTTSVANFTRSGSRMGEQDKGHVTTTAEGITVSDGTQDAVKIGVGAVDFHEKPVDGMYIPNGQMAATSVYTGACEAGWLIPQQVLLTNNWLHMVRGPIGFEKDGQFEIAVINGVVSFGIDDNGFIIALDNQQSGTTQKTGAFRLPWYGSREVTDTSKITAASGTNIQGLRFIQWGLTVNMEITFARTSATAANGVVTIGTLGIPESFPACITGGGNTNWACMITRAGVITARNITGAQIAANTSNTIGLTYILG